MSPEPVGSTHLRFGDARVVEIIVCSKPKVVRSPGRDPGRHEEFWNGPEVKNYIWEVEFRPSGKFRGSPVLYRDHRKGPGGPPGGATYPRGPHVLKWVGNQPLVGWCTPLAPLHLGLGILGEGAPPLALGGKSPPWPPLPLGDPIS